MEPVTPDNDVRRALAGLYSIERELGRGGMGIVYLAREVVLDRSVAIKVLPAAVAGDEMARDRFLREARSAARLFHPNIVPIHRVDQIGGVVFMAMGFVNGESLGDQLARRGPLPAKDVVAILRETAWALGYAHARGIVHRDIKPDNLLVERESGRTLVTDFGIAQVDGASSLTRDGQMVGSVSYMSPEQISGNAVDGRSDLYALGIVAHALLCGTVPFTHASATAVLAMHLTTPAPPIASRVNGLSARLAAAIDKCLAKDPADRHESVDAFAAALADIERPHEMPAPLRAWIAGTGMVDAGAWLLLGVSFLAVGWTAGNWWAFGIPLAYLAVQRMRQTRRLMSRGFTLEEMRAALSTVIQRETEEREAQAGTSPPGIAGALRVAARIAGWATIAGFASLVALLFGSDWIHSHPQALAFVQNNAVDWLAERFTAYGAIGWVGTRMLAEAIAPKAGIGFKLREYGARLRFWSSTAGGAFAKFLRTGLGHVRGAERDDHPTELVLGAAAASLFDALPPEVRKQFPELPAAVTNLEQCATRLRARIAESERREALGVDVAAQRTRAQERLGVAVAALETIRLDLLRMQVSRDSTGELTANVEVAARLAVEIDREIEARAEVKRLLA